MALTNDVSRKLEDTQAQIARLRAEVESLMKDRVTPAVSGLAGQAQDAYSSARKMVNDQSQMVSGQVRNQPLLAIAIAAAIGWVIGRVMR
ncbi:MAG TPA: hypothetical protein VE690_23635 [Rhodopila sp.]|nr:hypothetical protein [Rhodopila sp.]